MILVDYEHFWNIHLSLQNHMIERGAEINIKGLKIESIVELIVA